MWDFAAIWKLVSIALTASFGILGLVKDFKDKTSNRITIYGKISMAGIISSAAFGMIAQLEEQYSQEKAKDAVAKQTLEIVKNTQSSIDGIGRLVYRIGKPRLDLEFRYECNEKSKKFCSAIIAARGNGMIDDALLKSDLNPLKYLSLRIDLFRTERDFEETFVEGNIASDTTYVQNDIYPDRYDKNGNLISQASIGVSDDGLNLEVTLSTKSVDVTENNGRFVGINDLRGAYFIIFGLQENLKIEKFIITTDTNIASELSIDRCQYVRKETFRRDRTPTAFNHLGDYVNACRFSDRQDIDTKSRQ